MRTGVKRYPALRALAVAAAVLAWAAPGAAQDDRQRGLYDTAFTENRPKPQKPKTAARKPVRYKRATQVASSGSNVTPGAKPPVGGVSAGAPVIGVTVWRLRPSAASDDATARILVHGPASSKDQEWTPERVEADTPLSVGQRVRLSVESPREGYLYVFDREQYADGSYGPAYLIFPTTRLRAGDNAVKAGAVVEIPAQADDPAYFTLQRSRPDQVAEMITVLVTPQRLDLAIGAGALEIGAAQLATWESQWGALAERLEMADGAGKAYTPAEKAAGATSGTLLTKDDPLPQTIYRVDARPGAPVLVNIPLRIAR